MSTTKIKTQKNIKKKKENTSRISGICFIIYNTSKNYSYEVANKKFVVGVNHDIRKYIKGLQP